MCDFVEDMVKFEAVKVFKFLLSKRYIDVNRFAQFYLGSFYVIESEYKSLVEVLFSDNNFNFNFRFDSNIGYKLSNIKSYIVFKKSFDIGIKIDRFDLDAILKQNNLKLLLLFIKNGLTISKILSAIIDIISTRPGAIQSYSSKDFNYFKNYEFVKNFSKEIYSYITARILGVINFAENVKMKSSLHFVKWFVSLFTIETIMLIIEQS